MYSKSNVHQFINAFILAIHSVEKIYVSLLIQHVLTTLYRKALKRVRYKNTTTWINIKKTFKERISVVVITISFSSKTKFDENEV